jgi:hypothetical protein
MPDESKEFDKIKNQFVKVEENVEMSPSMFSFFDKK